MSSFTFSIFMSLGLIILFISFQCILLISLSRKLFYGINANRLSKLAVSQKAVHISAIACYCFFVLAGLCLMILRVHDIYIQDITNYFSNIFMITHLLYMIFMGTGWNCAYIFMFTRLYATFEDTKFKVTKKAIYTHIFIAIYSLLAGWICIILAKLKLCPAAIIDTIFILSKIPGLFAQLHLIFQFNYRLFKMAVQSQNEPSLSPTDDINVRQLSEKQIFMLSVVRKHTILGVTLLFTLLICMLDYLLAVNVYAASPNYTDSRIVYPHYMVLSTYLDTTSYMSLFDIIHVFCVNMVTFIIYLGFSVNKSYYLYLCNSIDLICKDLCESLAGSNGNDYQTVKNDAEASQVVVDIDTTQFDTAEISL